MNSRNLAAAALLAAFTLAACSGGSPSIAPPGPPGLTPQAQSEDAVNAANGVGTPIHDTAISNETMSSPLQSGDRVVEDAPGIQAAGDGSCNAGVEFFSPDRKRDANSTERIVFYDNACTKTQSDTVRLFASTGPSSESVTLMQSRYPLGSATPSSVRSERTAFSNATFDKFGYPIYKNGFARSQIAELDVNGSKTLVDDGELVVKPAGGNASVYCSDSAGYNVTGDATLKETFGWSGLVFSGTRTVNNDGSISWSFTHGGTSYAGAIGALSVQSGNQNTNCPIGAPMFKLAGGTAKGSYVFPIQSTYKNGVLADLSIANATLSNGETLNVRTNSALPASDPHFVSGSLSKGAALLATFNVNAFGDGTLVVTSTGKPYHMEDWHVTK